jgi:hypothetical protein
MLLANDPGNPTNGDKFDQIIASGKTTTVILKQPLPIFLMYLTTNVQDGVVLFKPDLYSRDPGIFNALNRQPSPLQQPTQIPEIRGQSSTTTGKIEHHVSPPERGTPGLHYAQGTL